MRGLLLSNLYSIERSVKGYTLLSIVVMTILLMTNNATALKISLFLPIVWIATTALETLKHDGESGWNKYEIMLPVKRAHIIKSKYFTFLLLVILGVVVTTLTMLVISFLGFFHFTFTSFNYIGRGVAMALCAGALAYPLTYILGTKKSDTVILSSIGFSIGMWLLLGSLFSLSGQNSDEIFAVIHVVVSVLFFTLSYFICRVIYSRKEF